MRDRSNTISPIPDIARRIDVGVVGKSTAPASKHLLMPLFLLNPSAARASDGGISRTDERNRDAYQSSQQRHTCGKEPRRVTFPSDKPLRVFQGNASTRALCHGHNFPGFMGKHLSLRTGLDAPINTALLVHCAPVTLSFQDRPQVWPFVAIASRDSRSRPHVTSDPACRLLDLGERDRHTHARIPLAVLAKHFSRFVQLCAWQSKGTIDGAVPVRRDVEAAVLAPRGGRATEHDPQIEAFRLARLLHFRAVDQFGLERSRDMSGLGRSLKVDVGAAIGTTDELAEPFRAGEAAPLLSHETCAIRVRALEKSRQKRECIGLVRGRIELELVRQVHGLHERSIIKRADEHKNPAPRKVSLTSDNGRRAAPQTALFGAYANCARPRSPMQFERRTKWKQHEKSGYKRERVA